MSAETEALAVALEHVHWCRCRGFSPAEICAALGARHVPAPGRRGWDDALWLVAGAWLELPNSDTARAVRRPAAQSTLPGIAPPGSAKGEIAMSRIRSLHPSQWTEGNFARSSPAARLLLLGLRNEADDHGVFLWDPLSLKLRLLPLDACDIEALLIELVDRQLIAAYEIDGRGYGICLSWDQQPQHPSYRHPLPPADAAAPTAKSSVTAHEPSRAVTSPHPELESESESKKGASRRRATPAPPPEDLPDEWREAARRQRAERGEPEADLDAQWRRFRNRNAGEADTPARWRGRWLNWAEEAKPMAGNGADPPAGEGQLAARPERPAEPPEQLARRLWWGRSPDWWNRFPTNDRLHAQAWVDRGTWGERWFGGPPGSPDCKLDAELAQAAVAERVHRAAPGNGQAPADPPADPAPEAATAAALRTATSPRRRDAKRRRPPDLQLPGVLSVMPGGGAGATATSPSAEPPPAEPVRASGGAKP
jgi:hypothetical protein